MKTNVSQVIFGLIVGILIGHFIITPLIFPKNSPTTSKEENRIKQKPVEVFLFGTPIEIKSKVIEVSPNLDLSHQPSYCRPEAYTIMKVRDNYFVKLPGGTFKSTAYKSITEAQMVINEQAKYSYDRWVNSGGIDY